MVQSGLIWGIIRGSVWRGWLQPRNTWQDRRPPVLYLNRAHIKHYLPVLRHCMIELFIHKIVKWRHWVLEIGGEIRGIGTNGRQQQNRSRFKLDCSVTGKGMKNQITMYVLLGKPEAKRPLGRTLDDLTVPPQHSQTDPYRCVRLATILMLIAFSTIHRVACSGQLLTHRDGRRVQWPELQHQTKIMES
jgi:hypothetical protein